MDSVKVFVVDAEGKPLLPTHPARARKLLDMGRAEVFRVVPFTIQLKHPVDHPVGEFTVGIDDGAKEVGIVVVDERRGEVVFGGVIQLRQDVKRKMTQRRMYRRSRRSRSTRYRKARFNRSRAEGWLSPTIRQKKDSIVRVVQDLHRLIPLKWAVVEQGQFDTASLAASRQLSGKEYQIPDYAGRDFREKVLWRDRFTCQHCGSLTHLQAHHIVPRAQGGTDTPQNGITLCEVCHTALHRGEWVFTGKPKQFVYPAHLQIGKHYLVEQLERTGLQVELCVGWMTRFWRQQIGLDKSHLNDAVAMVCQTYAPRLSYRAYHMLPKRKKIWEDNPTKTCTEKRGFRHWDLVKASHRTRGTVIGSVRSLKKNVITLRTAFDDDFPVAYTKSRLLWRFNTIIYI